MQESAQLMSLTDDFFNTAGDAGLGVPTIANNHSGDWSVGSSVNWCYPYYQPWAYSYKPQITLALSEVEHLRKLAKGDKKLRKTLKKFAPYIAVEVDFPG